MSGACCQCVRARSGWRSAPWGVGEAFVGAGLIVWLAEFRGDGEGEVMVGEGGVRVAGGVL